MDKTLGEIGAVARLYNLPNNDLFAFDYQGNEVLVPVDSPFVLQVDKGNKIINTDLPEGYLDIYTSQDHSPDDWDEEDNEI